MAQLPLELWRKILDNVPPLSSPGLAKKFGYKSKEQHEKVWEAIFRDDVWATIITTLLGYDLILVGNDLQNNNFAFPKQNESFIALILDEDLKSRNKKSSEQYDDLLAYKEVFLKSLQKHEVSESGSIRL